MSSDSILETILVREAYTYLTVFLLSALSLLQAAAKKKYLNDIEEDEDKRTAHIEGVLGWEKKLREKGLGRPKKGSDLDGETTKKKSIEAVQKQGTENRTCVGVFWPKEIYANKKCLYQTHIMA